MHGAGKCILIPLVSSRSNQSAPGHRTARFFKLAASGVGRLTGGGHSHFVAIDLQCFFSLRRFCAASPAGQSRRCPAALKYNTQDRILSSSKSSLDQRMISRILTWSQTCSTVFALLPPFHQESLTLCCAHTFTEPCVCTAVWGPVGCTWCWRGVVECCADAQRMVSRFLLLPSNGQNKEQVQRSR